jgi:hypothetical protein
MSAPAGRNSEFSATLTVSGGDAVADGAVFVKGITVERPEVKAHRHEARVNAWLPAVAPRLLWTVEVDGWLLLGYDHVDGRHANLSPGSPDLPLVAEAVRMMAAELTPCPVEDAPSLATQWERLAAWRRLTEDPPADLDPWVRANLDRLAGWETGAVDGGSLVHTDLHSLNILVGTSARVVDWAWSRRAASWVDVSFLALRLMDAGHPPAAAEEWADNVIATPDDARTAFAIGVLGIWEFLQRDKPLPHRAKLTDIARMWVRHRLGQ